MALAHDSKRGESTTEFESSACGGVGTEDIVQETGCHDRHVHRSDLQVRCCCSSLQQGIERPVLSRLRCRDEDSVNLRQASMVRGASPTIQSGSKSRSMSVLEGARSAIRGSSGDSIEG